MLKDLATVLLKYVERPSLTESMSASHIRNVARSKLPVEFLTNQGREQTWQISQFSVKTFANFLLLEP